MDCETARPMISALYDGEVVGSEAARHLSGCEACRETLSEYAEMTVNMRLLAAQESGESRMQSIHREALPHRNSIRMALLKPFRVPRFAAAICALVIVLLAGGLARTRAQAQVGEQYFQFRLTQQVGGQSAEFASGEAPICESGCEQTFHVFGGDGLGAIVHVMGIQDGKVHLTIQVKRFASAPDMHHFEREMNDVPARSYVYSLGQSLQVPLFGGGEVTLEGVITTSKEAVPGWNGIPSQSDEDLLVVRDGILIRDKKVIGNVGSSVLATGRFTARNMGFYVYLPKEGLFAIGLKQFEGAFQASADFGHIRFTENGVKYMLLSATPVTGGTQPRPVWVLHLPDYLPSQHGHELKDDSFMMYGSGTDIEKDLRQMGAL